MTAVWASIFLGLRSWRGLEPYDYWQLRRNLGFMALLPAAYDVYKRTYAWFVVILAAPVQANIHRPSSRFLRRRRGSGTERPAMAASTGLVAGIDIDLAGGVGDVSDLRVAGASFNLADRRARHHHRAAPGNARCPLSQP